MPVSTIVTANLEGAGSSRAEDVAKLLCLDLPVTRYWSLITGYGDTNKKIAAMKGGLSSKFASAMNKRGMDQLNALGIPLPDRIKTLTARTAQVTLGTTLPDTYTFVANVNYTAANMNLTPTNFEFRIAAKGALIAIGEQLQTVDDSFGVIELKVKEVARQLDGGANITVEITSPATVADNITNTTAKTIVSLGTYNGESSDLQDNPDDTSTTRTFTLAKMQKTIKTTPEAEKTNYDTVDKPPFSTDKYLAKAMNMIKTMNNALVIAVGGSLIDQDNNAYNVPVGLMNTASIGSFDGSAVGLGPTLLRNMSNDIIYNGSSQQVPFEMHPDGKPILDVMCDAIRGEMLDDMLRTIDKFGTRIQTKMGDREYDVVLETIRLRDCHLRMTYERSLDNAGYRNQIAMFNRNNITPTIKKGFFFDVGYSTGDSDTNKAVFSMTTIYTQILMLLEQVVLGTEVNFLQPS